MPKLVKAILINIFVIISLLGLLELFLFITLKCPTVQKILPSIITKISRRIYFYYDMNSIQYLPACARFDPELGYTLKPGQCVFLDFEFSTKYSINSLGVRDTEEALNSPQIVVVGDSYAMGWGAEQNETFAKVIEAKTGLSVLNCSCSSYGTAREMLLLKKVKRDRMKYLIIQYCNNDYEENLSFLENGNKLKTMSREQYEKTALSNERFILTNASMPGKGRAVSRPGNSLAPSGGVSHISSAAEAGGLLFAESSRELSGLSAPAPVGEAPALSENELLRIKEEVYRDLLMRIKIDFERGG